MDKQIEQLVREAQLCEECDSDFCAFARDGICKVPFVTGKAPRLNENGCDDYCFKEENS